MQFVTAICHFLQPCYFNRNFLAGKQKNRIRLSFAWPLGHSVSTLAGSMRYSKISHIANSFYLGVIVILIIWQIKNRPTPALASMMLVEKSRSVLLCILLLKITAKSC